MPHATAEARAAYQKAHRKKTREQRLAYNRAWWAKNGGEPARRRWKRDWDLRRLYGISFDDYDRMHAEQGGKCKVCGKPARGTYRNRHTTTPARLVVDHCHHTGRVRGLLCTPCNRAVGFMDKPEWLEAALRYLRA